jgi:hypothetical protein
MDPGIDAQIQPLGEVEGAGIGGVFRERNNEGVSSVLCRF